MKSLQQAIKHGMSTVGLAIGALLVVLNLLKGIFDVIDPNLVSSSRYTITGLVVAVLLICIAIFFGFSYINLKETALGRRAASSVPLLMDKDTITDVLIQVVESADGILLASGSKAHNKKYIGAIEKWAAEVDSGKRASSKYTRILHGSEVTEELREHIVRMKDYNRQSSRMRFELLQVAAPASDLSDASTV